MHYTRLVARRLPERNFPHTLSESTEAIPWPKGGELDCHPLFPLSGHQWKLLAEVIHQSGWAHLPPCWRRMEFLCRSPRTPGPGSAEPVGRVAYQLNFIDPPWLGRHAKEKKCLLLRQLSCRCFGFLAGRRFL